MTSRLPMVLAIIGLTSTSILSTPFAAKAQDASPKTATTMPEKGTPPKPESMTKIPGSAPEASESQMFSAQDRAAFLDARVAALHAGLTLTPDQEKIWPPVEQALRDFSKVAGMQRQKMREKKQPLDFVEHLQVHSANMIARGEAMKKIADAVGPLYATFTEAQKRRLPILLRATMHPFKHMQVMMGGPGRGMMGMQMMHKMCHGMMMGQDMMGKGMMGQGKMTSPMMGGAGNGHKN